MSDREGDHLELYCNNCMRWKGELFQAIVTTHEDDSLEAACPKCGWVLYRKKPEEHRCESILPDGQRCRLVKGHGILCKPPRWPEFNPAKSAALADAALDAVQIFGNFVKMLSNLVVPLVEEYRRQLVLSEIAGQVDQLARREIDLDSAEPPLPQLIDGRTPEQLKADGDDRWPDGTPYTPPGLADAIREKSEQIESAGLCQWGYRTLHELPNDLPAMDFPDKLDGPVYSPRTVAAKFEQQLHREIERNLLDCVAPDLLVGEPRDPMTVERYGLPPYLARQEDDPPHHPE